MKLVYLRILFASALFMGAACAQDLPKTEEDLIVDEAKLAMWWGDFDALERMHEQFQQRGERTAAGRSKLVLFREGISLVMAGPKNAKDAFFDQMEAVTLMWAQQHPKSALAHVLHAAALSTHGWSYRGSGYANTVPPEAWKDYSRYLSSAINYLAANKAVAMQSSSGYVQLLNLGRDSGWEMPALWATAQAGMAVNADDEGLFRTMLNRALPKWGGSVVLVDRVINDIAKLTSAVYGDIYYSRMYAWASDWQFEQRLFEDSGANWPRMKSGYQQLLARYPSPVNVNVYAHFACLARDKSTLQELLVRVGPKPMPDTWGSNTSRTFETCKRWASEI